MNKTQQIKNQSAHIQTQLQLSVILISYNLSDRRIDDGHRLTSSA